MTNPSDITIVMVDDNVDEIHLTRRLVRHEGIINNFVSERRPDQLFETLCGLRGAGVDTQRIILLLDVNMPRLDGFEVLEQVRASALYRNTPVIMLSATDDAADRQRALALGANGYMVKPFRKAEFLTILNGLPQVRHQLIQAA